MVYEIDQHAPNIVGQRWVIIPTCGAVECWPHWVADTLLVDWVELLLNSQTTCLPPQIISSTHQIQKAKKKSTYLSASSTNIASVLNCKTALVTAICIASCKKLRSFHIKILPKVTLNKN